MSEFFSILKGVHNTLDISNLRKDLTLTCSFHGYKFVFLTEYAFQPELCTAAALSEEVGQVSFIFPFSITRDDHWEHSPASFQIYIKEVTPVEYGIPSVNDIAIWARFNETPYAKDRFHTFVELLECVFQEMPNIESSRVVDALTHVYATFAYTHNSKERDDDDDDMLLE